MLSRVFVLLSYKSAQGGGTYAFKGKPGIIRLCFLCLFPDLSEMQRWQLKLDTEKT